MWRSSPRSRSVWRTGSGTSRICSVFPIPGTIACTVHAQEFEKYLRCPATLSESCSAPASELGSYTFGTEYVRRGGEVERLRRILGHTTYVMVMRYVHLDKADLGKDYCAYHLTLYVQWAY